MPTKEALARVIGSDSASMLPGAREYWMKTIFLGFLDTENFQFMTKEN